MTDAADTTEAPVYAKGTWQESLNKSTTILERSVKARKSASALLWNGAKAGIEEWFPNSATDTSAEAFAAQVLDILGASRKGDASKIKTVALAVRNHSLDLADYPNLSKAYAKALDLTKGAKERKAQDTAAEDVIETLEVPKTATTASSAALILLGKGIDGAVVAILDALNGAAVDAEGKTINNEAAHRAFMRAVSTEIASRVQAAKPKPAPKVSTPKAGATKAKAGAKATAPAPAATKAKPKGKPVKKAAAAPAPVEDPSEPGDGEVDDLDEMLDDIDSDSSVEVEETPAPAKKRATPVKRPARPHA